MNGRELAFCAHYAVNRSAREAAMAAGYSATYARNANNFLLRKPHIQEQLNFLAERANQQVALDAAMVLNNLGAVAITRPDELIKQGEDGIWVNKSPEELSPRQLAAIKKIHHRAVWEGQGNQRQFMGTEWSYELHDKMAALFKLGDHFGVGDTDSKSASRGNPFEEMEQEELDAISNLMEKAMDRKAIEGEVVNG